jgi:hypothetical protein
MGKLQEKSLFFLSHRTTVEFYCHEALSLTRSVVLAQMHVLIAPHVEKLSKKIGERAQNLKKAALSV